MRVNDSVNHSDQSLRSSTTPGVSELNRSSTLDTANSPIQSTESEYGHPHRRSWVWIAVLVVFAFVLWFGIRELRGKPKPAAGKGRGAINTPVVAAVAHPGNIGVYFTGLGAVTPIYTVTVKTRVDGQILAVNYKEGQAVHKGVSLVEIDPRPYQVQLMQAEGQLARDQAALTNAQTDLQRYTTLLAKNAIAQQIYATQKATVAQNQGAVKTDEGNIAAAKLNIAYCHITAPIDGNVGLRLVDPGNLVSASAGTALVVITQTSPISVIFTLPEQQVPPVLKRVRAGQHLAVDALDRDSKTVVAHGQLTTLDNQIDQTTGTLKMRATFPNKDSSLFPNQFVNAQVLVEEKRNVTLVPNAAIQRNGSTTFVYLVKPDHTVTVRDIKIGTANADETEITSGISNGDVLVTQGVDKLQEGSPVQAQIQQPGNPAGASSASAQSTSDKSSENGTTSTSASRGNRHASHGSQNPASATQ
jgi:multidrug efflux system membrane fusion protein